MKTLSDLMQSFVDSPKKKPSRAGKLVVFHSIIQAFHVIRSQFDRSDEVGRIAFIVIVVRAGGLVATLFLVESPHPSVQIGMLAPVEQLVGDDIGSFPEFIEKFFWVLVEPFPARALEIRFRWQFVLRFCRHASQETFQFCSVPRICNRIEYLFVLDDVSGTAGRIRIDRKRMLGLVVPIPLEPDAERTFYIAEFRVADGTKFRTSESEIAQTKQNIRIPRIGFRDEPSPRAAWGAARTPFTATKGTLGQGDGPDKCKGRLRAKYRP